MTVATQTYERINIEELADVFSRHNLVPKPFYVVRIECGDVYACAIGALAYDHLFGDGEPHDISSVNEAIEAFLGRELEPETPEDEYYSGLFMGWDNTLARGMSQPWDASDLEGPRLEGYEDGSLLAYRVLMQRGEL